MPPDSRAGPVEDGRPIDWRTDPDVDTLPPSAAEALVTKAIAARPANALLRLKLADLRLDSYDFTAAAAALEEALGLDARLDGARVRLARCCNHLGRHRQALDVLGPLPSPQFERAVALAALGRTPESERELRALLGDHPGHSHALRRLARILRHEGRVEELLELCEGLRARGANHAQLLYSWGTALGLAGRNEEARALLLNPDRIVEIPLPAPEGFADIAEFNSALAEEILGNPHKVSEFPVEVEANRGSSRVHALFAGRRPELIRTLLDSLRALIGSHATPLLAPFDPWADARPATAHLKAWGLIQRGGDYEEWHNHPGGWLSGVYYVKVPACVSAGGAGRGCIEFGPPTSLARLRPGFVPVWRHAPGEGHLLLAPSHYPHRTIPTGAAEPRISFAFDVVPDGCKLTIDRSARP